jgi:hypothetical protein
METKVLNLSFINPSYVSMLTDFYGLPWQNLCKQKESLSLNLFGWAPLAIASGGFLLLSR